MEVSKFEDPKIPRFQTVMKVLCRSCRNSILFCAGKHSHVLVYTTRNTAHCYIHQETGFAATCIYLGPNQAFTSPTSLQAHSRSTHVQTALATRSRKGDPLPFTWSGWGGSGWGNGRDLGSFGSVINHDLPWTRQSKSAAERVFKHQADSFHVVRTWRFVGLWLVEARCLSPVQLKPKPRAKPQSPKHNNEEPKANHHQKGYKAMYSYEK